MQYIVGVGLIVNANSEDEAKEVVEKAIEIILKDNITHLIAIDIQK